MTFTFPFSPPFFFPFFSPGNLQGFILVGKDFGKTLRIIGLEKQEVQAGSTSNNNFIGIFRSSLYGIFVLFSRLFDWNVLLLVWF